jgi:hypothetical protein
LNFFSPLLISIDIHAVGSFFLPAWREKKKNRTDREVELRNSCQMTFFCFFLFFWLHYFWPESRDFEENNKNNNNFAMKHLFLCHLWSRLFFCFLFSAGE